MKEYKSETKMNMGLMTYCPICGAVLKNTAIMGMRKDKRSKIYCPYCGRALKPRKVKVSQEVMKQAFLKAVTDIGKLSKDRVIPNP